MVLLNKGILFLCVYTTGWGLTFTEMTNGLLTEKVHATLDEYAGTFQQFHFSKLLMKRRMSMVIYLGDN